MTILTQLRSAQTLLTKARAEVEEFTCESGLITSAIKDVARAIEVMERKEKITTLSSQAERSEVFVERLVGTVLIL